MTWQLNENTVTKEVTSLPAETAYWEDMLSGTRFFLTKEDANRITALGRQQMNRLKDDVEAVINWLKDPLTTAPDMPEAALYPEMPYLPALTEPGNSVHRVSDHLLLRNGLVYGLMGMNLTRDELDLVRRESLLAEPGTIPSGVDESLWKAVESLLCGLPFKDQESFAVTLVSGGVYKVKSYYLETSKIKEIRGASRVLDQINRQMIPDWATENLVEESLVYTGGGNTFLVAPLGTGPGICQELETVYEQTAVTAASAFEWIECRLDELLPQLYGSTLKRLHRKIALRQQSKLDWVLEPLATERKGAGSLNGFVSLSDINRRPVCDHCNLRTPAFVDLKSEEQLCFSCTNKNQAGSRESKKETTQLMVEYCRFHEMPLDRKYMAETLEDIAESGKNTKTIGVIYGDGNNMGAVIQRINSLTQSRMFSVQTEKAIFRAVFQAVSECVGSTAVEIIAIGGDDIFMIVPGDSAFATSVRLGEIFDDQFRNLSDGTHSMTMSVGLVISKPRNPVQYLFDLAQQLLVSAKKKAKVTGKGTIDYMAVDSNVYQHSTVAALRKDMVTDDLAHTLRPYTWEESRKMMEVVRELSKARLSRKAYQFREALFQLSPVEAGLFYAYKLSTEKNPQASKTIKRSVMELAAAFQAKANQMTLAWDTPDQLAQASPWLDIVELWPYCVEKGSEDHGETSASD